MGSSSLNQGSNPGPVHWSLNHWATMEVPHHIHFDSATSQLPYKVGIPIPIFQMGKLRLRKKVSCQHHRLGSGMAGSSLVKA